MQTDEKLRHPKMARVIADRVRAEIASGKLENGLRLPTEPELISLYGVSRGVIREALRLLEASGLVDVRRGPKGGAIVTHPQPTLVRESLLLSLQLAGVRLGGIYEALKAIEPAAARMAAELRPAEAEAALLDHTERQAERTGDIFAFGRDLHGFHEVMIANCGNDTIRLLTISLMETLRCTTEPFAKMVMRQIGEEEYRQSSLTMIELQRRLAKIIGKGDGAQAEVEWRAFMDRVGRRFFELVPPDLEIM